MARQKIVIETQERQLKERLEMQECLLKERALEQETIKVQKATIEKLKYQNEELRELVKQH